MADFEPPPPNPTNADLARSLVRLHECVESGKVAVAQTLGEIQAHLKEREEVYAQNLKFSQRRDTGMIASFKKINAHLNTLTFGQKQGIEERIKISDNVDNLNKAFALKSDEATRKHKPIALMSQFEFATKLGGLAVLLGGLWKILDALWPSIVQGTVALRHVVVGH